MLKDGKLLSVFGHVLTMFVKLSETMNMLSVQCFQYLCITTLYLFTGITLVNKMEQLKRKIEAVESRKDQIMYQTHFLVLKAKFFNDFCQQDPSKMERTFTLRIQQSVTERQGNTERQGKVDMLVIFSFFTQHSMETLMNMYGDKKRSQMQHIYSSELSEGRKAKLFCGLFGIIIS
jgi:hypothetical protein